VLPGQFTEAGVHAERAGAGPPQGPYKKAGPAANVDDELFTEIGVLAELADRIHGEERVIAGRVGLLGAERPDKAG
jgi:hypothetical protein